MNRIIGSIAIFVLIASFTSESTAAVRYVRNGDTLTKIARLTGHQVTDLVQMNGIKDPDSLSIGQRITFISQDDRLRAKVWAEKRRAELNPSDANFQYFGWVIEDLWNNHLRYSIDAYSGTHFESIIAFAKAQGKIYRVKWKSNVTDSKGHGSWMTKEKAENRVTSGNRRWPELSHWVECR